MKKMLAAAVVLVLIALGSAVLAPTWSTSPPRTSSPAVLQAASSGVRAADADVLARTEAPLAGPTAANAATTGSIVLRTSFDSGKPMPNQPFRYSIEEGEMNPIAPTALTDATGTARIDGLVPGTWRIELAGWARERNGTRRANVTTGGVTVVEIVQPAKYDRPFALRGRVVHATGQPAAGATLVCAGCFTLGAVPCGVAGTDGSFAVTMPISGVLGVGACLAGHAPSAVRFFDPSDSVTLVLGGPEAIVRGTVVDGEGRAIAGATVELAPRDRWVPESVEDDLAKPPSPQIATTDAAGQCTLSELVAAPLRVASEPGGSQRSRTRSRPSPARRCTRAGNSRAARCYRAR